jgi:hypothetical protein
LTAQAAQSQRLSPMSELPASLLEQGCEKLFDCTQATDPLSDGFGRLGIQETPKGSLFAFHDALEVAAQSGDLHQQHVEGAPLFPCSSSNELPHLFNRCEAFGEVCALAPLKGSEQRQKLFATLDLEVRVCMT